MAAIKDVGRAYKDVRSANGARQKAANDYAMNMRTKQRAIDPTFGYTEEQFNKWDRAERSMETTDKGLSLIERNWKAVLILFLIVLVLYFVFRNKIQDFFNTFFNKIKNISARNAVEKKTGQKCTLSESELEVMCASIQTNHDGGGENEYGAAVQICKCQNQADWESLKATFGVRTIDRPFLIGDKDFSLEDLITEYWKNAPAACSKVYSHFKSKNIKDDAILYFLYQYKS